MDEETEFLNERAVLERVSHRNTISSEIDRFDLESIFRNNVEIIGAEIHTSFPKFFSESDKAYVIEKISDVKHSGFKNASSYILGYIFFKTLGNTLKLDYIYNKIAPILADKIEKADIIRYANLWKKMNK